MKRLAPLAVAAVMILAALNVLASAATPTAPCSDPSCGAPVFCNDPSCLAMTPVGFCDNPSCE